MFCFNCNFRFDAYCSMVVGNAAQYESTCEEENTRCNRVVN